VKQLLQVATVEQQATIFIIVLQTHLIFSS